MLLDTQMLLNEFYTPSKNDLKVLALIVLGKGSLPVDTLKGQEPLIQSAKRLSNLGIITSIADNLVLTSSGESVSKLNGLVDDAGEPTKNSYNATNPNPESP